jgi:hypothetical protein
MKRSRWYEEENNEGRSHVFRWGLVLTRHISISRHWARPQDTYLHMKNIAIKAYVNLQSILLHQQQSGTRWLPLEQLQVYFFSGFGGCVGEKYFRPVECVCIHLWVILECENSEGDRGGDGR